MNVKAIDLDEIEKLLSDLMQEKIIVSSIQNDFKSLTFQFEKTIERLQNFLSAMTK